MMQISKSIVVETAKRTLSQKHQTGGKAHQELRKSFETSSPIQGHTSSTKATPRNPFQTVPPTGPSSQIYTYNRTTLLQTATMYN